MKVSSTWLLELLRRTMLNTELIQALEQAGIEVEQYSSPNPIDKNIVVGLVKKVVQHPGADRLKIATVDDGREELIIVCGAPNVRAGLKAPIARLGAVLPDGTVIAEVKLRGEVSYGMLCSERELGLGESHEGLLELSDDLKVGTPLCDIYPSDGWIDIKTPPNRFDLLGAVGLAREASAMSNNELVLPSSVDLPAKPVAGLIGKLGTGCTRFVVVEMEVDGTSPTPAWMAARLAVAGMRSLGLLVDVTNYVMLETAQPLHAYDFAKVKLPFGVRLAEAGEKLVTLDAKSRSLHAGDILVTDADSIIGLAGVRGGAATEITPATKRIYLEAATFDGAAIRQAAKRHNLRTDASARFERGLPPEAGIEAIKRAVALLIELGAGKVVRWADAGETVGHERTVSVTAEHASRILGTPAKAKDIVAALEKLQIGSKAAGETVTATIPWWRPDIKEAEDLIEETVRVMGYDAIPSTLPMWRPRNLQFDRTRPALRSLRNLLSGAGLFEVMTYSFVSAEQLADLGLVADAHLKLQNPLSSEQAYLRTTLLPSHLAVAERNRVYSKNIEFYELSSVFVPRGAGEQPNEPLRLGLMIGRPADAFRRAKGCLDALGKAINADITVVPTTARGPWAHGRVAEIWLGKAVIGTIGQLNPAIVDSHKLTGELAYAELEIEPLLAAAKPVQFAGLSRFPAITRDLTVIVPQTVTWQAVAEALTVVPNLVATFGSDYAGKGVPSGHKSLSLHLRLTNPERTPTDAEADDLEAKVKSILRRSVGAETRD